ncbi:50S ribosomal protein L28 [Candidatus Hodgkinia cicadicola]|nr:50S ribosomal protein L28 [Candidatus Hodgkinia cicadicola]
MVLTVRRQKLWSFALKQFVKLRISALRLFGGIDFYIVNFKRLPKQFVTLKMALLAAVLE